MNAQPERTYTVFARGIAAWFLIIAVETVHGVIRTLLIEPALGDLRARQVGVFIGSALIIAVSLITVRWIGARSAHELLMIGVIWVILTVVFEFILGFFVAGLSIDRILSDYDLSRGGLMVFGLLIMLAAPYTAAYLRGFLSDDPD